MAAGIWRNRKIRFKTPGRNLCTRTRSRSTKRAPATKPSTGELTSPITVVPTVMSGNWFSTTAVSSFGEPTIWNSMSRKWPAQTERTWVKLEASKVHSNRPGRL
jgi:hypothetical protein